MKKIKIIANPNAGRESALTKVLQLVKLLSKDKCQIILQFTHEEKDSTKFAMNDDGEDLVVCCGGDGTVNGVVNGLYRSERRKPLAILQCGTVNDFANSIKLPTNINDFYKMIKNGKTLDVDLGQANDRVFVNVAAGGLLTEIAYTTSEDKKQVLGSMAYYIDGAKELLKGEMFKPENLLNIKIKSDDLEKEEKVSVFIIANSPSVGGFKRMAPAAEVSDGYLDVIFIKGMEFFDIPEFVRALLNGNHVDHNKVIYLKTKDIEITSDKDIVVDLDGERSGRLPMRFKILEKALTVLIV